MKKWRPFQFHKGAIRTVDPEDVLDEMSNFNSIKVRLERKIGYANADAKTFQFHKSAIRTTQRVIDVLNNHISIP